MHSPLSPQLLGHGHGRQWSRGVNDGGSHPTGSAQAEFSSHFPPATRLGCGPRSLKSSLGGGGGPTLLLSTVEEAPPPGSLDLAGGARTSSQPSPSCTAIGEVSAYTQTLGLQESTDLGVLGTSSMIVLGARPQLGIRELHSVRDRVPSAGSATKGPAL